MSKNKKRSRRSTSPGMLLAGAGLIFIGMAALMLWPRPDTSVSPSSPSNTALTVPVEVNYAAPELTLSDLSGQEHSLADYRGQVVLVNLWATWCPPCKAEMPTLNAYYQEHAGDDFIIIAVNDGDPSEDVFSFYQEYNLAFPVWLDPTYTATEKAFKTLNLPSSFVIDRNGTIRLRWVGEIDRATLEKYVTPMIAE